MPIYANRLPRHPLTTLPPAALPGWVSATEWLRDVLESQPPMVATSHLLDRVMDMHAIAEGLLANSEAAALPDGIDAREQRLEGLAEIVAAELAQTPPLASPSTSPPAEAAPTAAEAPAAPPAQRGGHSTVAVYTPERAELLRTLWPTVMKASEILDRLNALPGAPPIASVASLSRKADMLRLSRQGLPIPEEFLPPQVEPPAGPTVAHQVRGMSGEVVRPVAELTEAELTDLKARYTASEESVGDLARAFRLTPSAVYSLASKSLWRRGRVGSPAPAVAQSTAPKPAPAPRGPLPYAPMTPEDLAEAREQLRTGKMRGARDLMEYYGCSPDEAQRIVDVHRAQAARAA